MNNEEALTELRLMMQLRMPKEVEAMIIAEKALQKQIPVKPMVVNGYPDDLCLCGRCGSSFTKHDYCGNCGQKIDRDGGTNGTAEN